MIQFGYIFFILFLFACGKTTSPYDEDQFQQNFFLENSGYYRTSLEPLNAKTGGEIRGKASIFINSIQFYAKVNLQSNWPGISFLQLIHKDGNCPTARDDFNHDGYIDAEETSAVVGRALIPLDYDLSTQRGKMGFMPFTDTNGRYRYSQAASSRVMISDLKQRDTDPLDFLGKIKQHENFDLNDMVVMIYGIPDRIMLPSSVAGLGQYPINLSLPVACGRLIATDEVFP